MFIKLTNKNDQIFYVNTDNITNFSKSYHDVYTWVKFTGDDEELAAKETPEQIMELINEHK